MLFNVISLAKLFSVLPIQFPVDDSLPRKKEEITLRLLSIVVGAAFSAATVFVLVLLVSFNLSAPSLIVPHSLWWDIGLLLKSVSSLIGLHFVLLKDVSSFVLDSKELFAQLGRISAASGPPYKQTGQTVRVVRRPSAGEILILFVSIVGILVTLLLMANFWDIPIDRILDFVPSSLVFALNWIATGSRRLTTNSLQLQHLQIGETIVLTVASIVNLSFIAFLTSCALWFVELLWFIEEACTSRNSSYVKDALTVTLRHGHKLRSFFEPMMTLWFIGKH